ncbi:MAG: nucleotidyltransferase family protein, partial [Waterburya sp.]
LEEFKKFQVSKIGLFGSFVREEATAESDIDLLVRIHSSDWSNFCKLLDFVEDLFDRKVDVITEDSINGLDGINIFREVEFVN